MLFSFYIDTLIKKNSNAGIAFQKIDALAAAARQSGDDGLLAETALMKAHADYYLNHLSAKTVIQELDSLNVIAQHNDRNWLIARIEVIVSRIKMPQFKLWLDRWMPGARETGTLKKKFQNSENSVITSFTK